MNLLDRAMGALGKAVFGTGVFGEAKVPVQQGPGVTQAALPARRGYEYNIPDGGLTENNAGGVVGSDRRGVLGQLYESYLSCPWAWAAVNAIARTITAGGVVVDYTADDKTGKQEVPAKPLPVQALERLLSWCNEREDMTQLLRGAIIDLLIFGDAYIEVVWLAGVPVALYSLDAPTMYPIADAHGIIDGYVQITDLQQRAEFAAHEVIHISLDSPRSGIYGVSPTEGALLPITVWLFTAATIKEVFRKGNPPTFHADFPASMSGGEINRWVAKYLVQNLGPRNIGTPIPTKGGATLTELKQGALAEYLAAKDQARDEILATYGVPPAAAGVIESGNIGGGTGEAQDKTFRVNTCKPTAALVLEKLVYAIVRQGFGIQDWTLKFADVDMRDSQVIEGIRDTRIRNGTWTVNKGRADIGEAPVEGGDEAVIIDKQNIVLIRDLEAASHAGIAEKLKGTALEPAEPTPGKPAKLEKPEPQPVPPALAAAAGTDPATGQPAAVPDDGNAKTDGEEDDAKGKDNAAAIAKAGSKKKATEAHLVRQAKAVDEAWVSRYVARRRQAVADLTEKHRASV